ncbi:MAG: glycerol-3-phosphate 1-O-acyltransferase [Pseudomonadota bacterium]
MRRLDQYQQSTPWPEVEAEQVLFLLDARNDVEKRLLNDWLNQHDSDRVSRASRLALNLVTDQRDVDSSALAKALMESASALIVPLRAAWVPLDKTLDSGPRVRDLLLGDPRHPTAAGARRILKTSPDRLHLLRGEPDTVSNLQARHGRQHQGATEGGEAFARFVMRQAAIVLDLAERRLQGGRYKVPRHVAASLLADGAYNQALDELAANTGKDKQSLVREARGYMDELVSTPSTFWLDFYARFNRFCLGLAYEEKLVVDQAAVESMRQRVREHPSILLWTHKTYLDGMVVPKLLYDNDFPMPHMFGGANLNFPGLGFLLHRAGAIFIKRSFQENELYKITLRHYIGYLMEKRFPMNWSFEGTRSRLGKLMPPRYGLLKYVLEACHTTDAHNIHIIPISISYDLIRDVEEYATEQTGRGKGAESLRWLVGYIRSLARPMGRIYVDIGEPVVLPSAPHPSDSMALSKIAFEVAVKANEVTPLTLPSLVAISLLGSAPRALTEDEVVQDLRVLVRWAMVRKLRLSSDLREDYVGNTPKVIDFMIDEGIITRYDEGPETVYGIGLDQHPVASYYRNTVIHFFVNKAIIELALLKASENEGKEAVPIFWEEVDELRDLFKFEFFYAPTEEFHQQIRTELERYHPDWETLVSQGTLGFGQLLRGMTPLIAHVTLLTYTEAYSVVAMMLARLDTAATIAEEECVADALKFGRQAYLQRRISSESSIGKLLFRNGYKMLDSRGLTDVSQPKLADKRNAQVRDLRDILRRLDLIRAIGVASRGG